MWNMTTATLIGEIFYGILVFGILFFLFYKNKEKITVRQLLETSLFVGIALLFSVGLSYYISFGGAPVIKLGFSQIIMAIGGTMLTTPLGFLAGILVDFLGLLVSQNGLIYLGFTFNAAMCFLIGSLIFKFTKKFSEKQMLHTIYAAFIFLLGLGTYFLLTVKKQIKLEKLIIPLNDTTFLMPNRYLLLLLLFLIVGCMIIVIRYSMKFLKNQDLKEVYKWILVVLTIEIFINVILTSTHLTTMYQIPLQALLLPRIIKSIIMLPINIILGYTILNILRKIKI